MRPKNVALFALAGMLLTSFSVYSLTPPPAVAVGPDTSNVGIATELKNSVTDPSASDKSRFTAGKTLTVDARLGHSTVVHRGDGQTYVMLEVRGEGAANGNVRAPVNLSLVIDRSGSMAGTRMQNAIRAATTAVDRLNDGDVVNVVAFDTQPLIVVPPTTVGPGTRSSILTSIRSIPLGGDTCISCGISQGMAFLEATTGRVNQMIVLSDGQANNGIVDIPGFRNLAQVAMNRGTAITTIGVDVDYNEKILTAISQESNGRHYFVENDASLAAVFEKEAESTTSTVASNTEAAIDLAPGVELVRVFDRSFRRNGNRVIVSLGTFTKGEVKTVLAQVRVPTGSEGDVEVVNASVTYRDLVDDRQADCSGKLALEVTGDRSRLTGLDGVVLGRLNRSETAAALTEANFLFEQGKVAEARRRLETQASALRSAAGVAATAAPAPRKADVDRDFKTQQEDISRASESFAAPAPPAGEPVQASRPGKAAIKSNAHRSFTNAL